jgi:hypothetical protein
MENIGKTPATLAIYLASAHEDRRLTHVRWPADRLKGLARKTLLQGAFLTRPSPCGLNCSYTLTFAAPSLRCAEVTTMPNLTSATLPIAFGNTFINLKDSDPTHYNYMGAPVLSRDAVFGQSADSPFSFVVSYRAPNDDDYQFINCVTMDAKYNAEVEYKNGTQNINVTVTDEKPLNASPLVAGQLFYDLMNSEPRTDPVKYPTQDRNRTENEILDLMHGTQVRAISDAMLYCLSGYIQQYGTSADITHPKGFACFSFILAIMPRMEKVNVCRNRT